MWKELLDFDLRVDSQPSPLSSILNGSRFNRKLGGYAAVVNVGLNETWLGSHLSMSNLYAYGKMAWDPSSDPEALLNAWTKLTFSHDQSVIDTIASMSMASWPAYENYTGNLGIQTLTDILNAHYGPNPASQDNNPWGQWTRADADTIVSSQQACVEVEDRVFGPVRDIISKSPPVPHSPTIVPINVY